MKKREDARKMVQKADNIEKIIWNEKYKKLRNMVTARIRKENYDHNNNRIDNAKDEQEVWKVTNDIINPNNENSWSININNVMTTDTCKIANAFNNFFAEKIIDLKESKHRSEIMKGSTRKIEKQFKTREKFSEQKVEDSN